MAQSKKKVSVDQVLKLAEQLSPSEKGELRNRLDSSWGERWDALVGRVDERSSGLPRLTEEEIYAEFSKHRQEKRAKRAQSSD
jgi:hypothetical protein